MNIGREHTPLRTLVLEEVRERIIGGIIEPGSRLVEDQLAADLGVSRNPIREALRGLEAEGLVRMSPRRGAVVVDITPKEVVQVFEVRVALESLAARLASRKATPEQIERLRVLLQGTSSALETADARSLARRNTDFHREIHHIAGNHYLAAVMQTITGRMEWIFRQSAIPRGPGSLEEHASILEAITSGDEDLSARRATEHVLSAQRAYLEFLAASSTSGQEPETPQGAVEPLPSADP